MKKSVNTLLAVSLALIWAGSANAAVNWTFGSGGNFDTAGDNSYTKTLTDSIIGDITLTITAWASQGGNSSSMFGRETLTRYGGNKLGTVTNGRSSEPVHAVGDFYSEEFLLLEFTKPVAITQIGNGYARECNAGVTTCYQSGNRHSNNVDASILAHLGAGGPSPMTSYSSSGTAGLTNNGWQHFDASFNSGGTTGNFNPTPTSGSDPQQIFSNTWLIGNANEFISSSDSLEDFFKLNLVKTTTRRGCAPGDQGCGDNGVPTPATAALLGLGLLLLRRRVSQ